MPKDAGKHAKPDLYSREARECANVLCPNRPGEGMFRMVFAKSAGRDGDALLLYLCAPCASLLNELLEKRGD